MAQTPLIVGTWYVANPGGGTDQLAVTFLADGTFLVADKGTPARDPSGTSGLEWGTYSWNEVSGALSMAFSINTDGAWGLSNAGITTATVSGSSLTLSGTQGNFTIPRLISPPDSIVGSWYITNPGGGTDQLAITFLPDGTFLTADKGTAARDPGGASGIEWGTYSWNAATGAFTCAVLGDTDGHWGLSSAGTMLTGLHVVGDSLVATGPQGSLPLARLSPVATLTGTAAADTLSGSYLNETFTGFAGDDRIDGGGGIDTAVYAGVHAGYTVTKTASGFTVADNTGSDGTDTLSNVERLQFSNVKVALDVSGNAGITAKILGAVFGAASVHDHPDYMGIGLSLLDGGMSYASLMQLALNARLGAATHTQVVDLLYTNVVGTHPGAADLAYYVGLLDNGTFTPATLGVLAADTTLNQANINLVGLAQTGIEYI